MPLTPSTPRQRRRSLAGVDGAAASVEDQAVLGGAAGDRGKQGQRGFDLGFEVAVVAIAHRGATGLDLGDAGLQHGVT